MTQRPSARSAGLRGVSCSGVSGCPNDVGSEGIPSHLSNRGSGARSGGPLRDHFTVRQRDSPTRSTPQHPCGGNGCDHWAGARTQAPSPAPASLPRSPQASRTHSPPQAASCTQSCWFLSFARTGVRPRSLPDRRANTLLVSVEDVNPQVRHRMRRITGCLTPYDRDLPAPTGLRLTQSRSAPKIRSLSVSRVST